MRLLTKNAWTVLALSWSFIAGAAEPGIMDRLAAELRKASTYQYGEDDRTVKNIDRIIVEAAKDADQRAGAEQCLLAAAPEAKTRDAKELICRQLFIIGSAQSIPLLERWLLDPDVSHIARYALGRMPAPEAAAVIHRVLGKVPDPLQIGMINTLGNLRYQPAVDDLAQLLSSENPALVEAAAVALGQIGGRGAIRALVSIRSQVSGEARMKVDDALLACADALLAAERKPAAARIYQRLYQPEVSKHIRVGALRGLLAAQGPQALDLLIEAIKGNDPGLRANAIAFAAAVPGSAMTQSLVDLFPTLVSEAQEVLLNALAIRGDTSSVPAVMALINSDNERVRIAVLEALGTLGHPDAVGVLVQAAAASQGQAQQTARASLLRLSGPRITATLLQRLHIGTGKEKVEVIRALAGRRAQEAAQELLAVAGDNDPAVRRETIRALGILAGESEVTPLLSRLSRTADETDRKALSDSLELVLRRLPHMDRKAVAILTELDRAANEAKASLLPLLVCAPTERALATVLSAIRQDHPVVQDAAVRTLANWPDPAASDDLLALARSTRNPAHKVFALRGYVRLAGLASDAAARYERAMALAESLTDKQLVLAGLSSATSQAALDLALKYIADETLQADAAAAVTQIANQFRQKDAQQAKAALKTVVQTVKVPRLRQRAQDLINDLEKYEGYLLQWVIIGPYKDKDKEGKALFEAEFPPEKSEPSELKWQPLQKGIGAWDIVLDNALTGGDNQAAYLRTCLWSPETQEVQMELGSDDAIKVWLNRTLVHANFTSRGLSPRQDLVKVKLNQGWNDLLLKVVNHGGGWACCCRIRQPDGSALEGLKVKATSERLR